MTVMYLTDLTSRYDEIDLNFNPFFEHSTAATIRLFLVH